MRHHTPDAASLRCRPGFRKRDKLAGVKQALRIERFLDRLHDCNGSRVPEAGEFVALDLTNAVLRADRTSPPRYLIMDEAAHRLARRSFPRATLGPGFGEDVTHCTEFDQLPDAAVRYLQFIEDFLGVPVVMVSVGPKRSQSIFK